MLPVSLIIKYRPPERNPFPAGGVCFWPKRAGAEDL